MKPALEGIPESKTIVYPVWRDEREHWFTVDAVVGAFAMWAVRQSPYPVPDNLTENCVALTELLTNAVSTCERMEGFPQWFRASHEFVRTTLQSLFEQVPGIMAWNERKNGREGMGFSSRYWQSEPDDDFIDLDALARNVSHTLLKEALVDED